MFLLRIVYGIFEKIAKLFGYVLMVSKYQTGESNNQVGYEQVLPWATYAPWSVDNDFISIYGKIKNYTKVDKYRCFELWQLVKESSKLDGAIIEVGVWRGGSGCLIAKQAEYCNIKSTVYLCDTFTGVVKAGENDSLYKNGEQHKHTRNHRESPETN